MSSVNNGAAVAANPDTRTTTAPRKRRRRAPATGASEDCFTCRKRQVKCDRRRPYCTQCIDMGKDCSGYRTTLTWGVGVASRGKLRGLTLPIARSLQMPAARDSKPQSPATPTGKSPAPRKAAASPFALDTQLSRMASQSPISSPSGSVHNFDFSIPSTPPIPIHPSVSTPPPSSGWHVPGFEEHVEGYNAMSGKSTRSYLHPRPLQRLQTSMAQSYDDGPLSASAGSMSNFSDSDYPSPSEYPHTPEDYSFVEPMTPYAGPYLHHGAAVGSNDSLPFNEPPRSYPLHHDDLSSSISSDHSLHDFLDGASMHGGSVPHSALSSAFYGSGIPTSAPQDFHYGPHFGESRSTETHGLPMLASDMAPLSAPIPRSTYPSHCTALSPRIQFLLDYYEKAICPMLVAFDGPTNPYRMHVMHLAQDSESLQNAIAALSTNNIRMRGGTEHVRPQDILGSIHELRQKQGEPTAEELLYKAKSIELLNAQLADPSRARDDAILATLLILCLFHVCDSGISKFKIQLSGVQKLLKLRERDHQTPFLQWIELFFTWFDVMTSTVNDREMQVRSESLNFADISASQGGFEHLAGCDGRLFKLIARLGRLNLLSQNRPVRDDRDQQAPQPNTPTHPTPPRHRATKSDDFTPKGPSKDFYSLQPADPQHLDGNGWIAPIFSFSPPTDSAGFLSDPASRIGDARHEFWAEWREVRQQLQDWRLEAAPSTPDHPSPHHDARTPLSHSQRDLLHSSEAFRHAALLYTERLAAPSLPPSALGFQTLVAQALFHIAQIGPGSGVGKFLLWPLFVTGAECVDASQRAAVRERCLDIQRESGFANNLSGLEVLERVWREEDEDAIGAGGLGERERERGWGRQAGRWRLAMDRMEEEYIVV